MKLNFKKSLVSIGAGLAIVAPIAATTSCSLFEKSGARSKYEFYNYEDYMAPSAKDSIANTYDFYEFGDLPEIENGINDEIVGGAIGSDYFNTMLAGKGKIAKLDFSKLYGIESDRSKWAEDLKDIYTPATWNLLTSLRVAKLDENGNMLDADGNRVYNDNGAVQKNEDGTDRTPSYDVDGDGAEDFLWEYMAPYFIQNKVVAVNVDQLMGYNNAPAAIKDNDGDGHSDISNADFNALFQNKTYKGILDTLKGWGASKLTVNDYMRDNLMIGAQDNGGQFTGQINGKEYEKMIEGFKNTVSGWDSTPISSGVGALSSLVHAEGSDKKADAALMYNGDALMAWYGGTEDPDNDAGQIRIINPSDPSFLLDGFIIPSYVAKDYTELDRIYTVMNTYLYGSATTGYDENSQPVNGALAGVDFKKDFISGNTLYQNFDYVNYTAAFAAVDNYVKANYFGSGSDLDETAKVIYSSTEDNVAEIDQNHVTYPITNKQFSDASSAYESSKRDWK